jgi:hypothetical protein
MNLKKLALAAALAAALGAPLTVSADSSSTDGSTDAVANLDFEITIPSFVFLQVGSLSSIDEIVFGVDYTLDPPGTGSSVGSVPTPVQVIVRGNVPSIHLKANGTDTIDNGAPGPANIVIPWTEIGIADTGSLTHPTIDSLGVGGGVQIDADASGVIDVTEDWTFSFLNNAVYPSGTYNGSLVYTASTSP